MSPSWRRLELVLYVARGLPRIQENVRKDFVHRVIHHTVELDLVKHVNNLIIEATVALISNLSE